MNVSYMLLLFTGLGGTDVNGPYCVEKTDVFMAGSLVSSSYQAGSQVSQVHQAGSQKSEVNC